MRCVTVTWGAPSFWIERFPLYYGNARGFFEGRGVRPEIEIFHGGPELLRAVAEGRIHVGEIGLPPFIKAFSQGLAARLIGSTFIRRLDHFLAAKPEIRTVVDLKGKRIGILSVGSCDDYFLRHLLRQQGIDPDAEVEIVPLGPAYGDPECFATGRIDAGFLVEPSLSLAESKDYCRVLLRVGDYFPRYQWGGIFAGERFIRDHHVVLESLLAGYRQALRAMASPPDDCIEFGSKLFQVAPAVFRSALRRHLTDPELDARIDPQGLENCIRIQQELGAICGNVAAAAMVYQM